ncbi:hypothetical protein IWX78_003018 [Mycetocola sp. CAN_C7]|uniref:DUF6716 putative glycosyltransferase n=1 Tax=Mycetocola sp. CAN_C7 TaxID=2787724 RepID=UPI0018CA6D3D
MGRRVVGLVDSDSFVKWGAALLDSLPATWDISLVIVASALTASNRQVLDAVSGTRFSRATARILPVAGILRDEQITSADAVVVACRGPVAEVLLHALSKRQRRPVLVSGLPGISIPAKWKGIFYRTQSDLFVLHSHREVDAYRNLAAENGARVEFVLATLPFARRLTAGTRASDSGDSIVFAAQAIVPRERPERQLIADLLVELARRHPQFRIVLKVRALPGEEQTHTETDPLPELLPSDAPANLVVEAGSMQQHLQRAVGFATVSSTAVLEAAALDIPSLVLDEFGVGPLLINEVFEGSGLFGSAADLLALRFRSIEPSWLTANYAHREIENTFVPRLAALFEARDAGLLQFRPPARRSRGGLLRRAWDRRQALGRYDSSALGLVALIVGWPVFAVKRARRSRIAASARPESATNASTAA